MTNKNNDIVKETLKSIVDTICNVPIASTTSNFFKILYNKSIESKWKIFLDCSNINKSKLIEEINKNNLSVIEYLFDYFESIRTTPSLLAIKTMAIIFKDYQDNKEIQQRTCRAFSEMSDYELELYTKLYYEAIKIEKQNKNHDNINLNISKQNILEDLKQNCNFKFYLNDLSNRGFLFLEKNTGFSTYDTDTNFMFTLQFNATSKMYYNNILLAKEL